MRSTPSITTLDPQRIVPVLDLAPLVRGRGDVNAAASGIDAACRAHGFFYVHGHGVDPGLVCRLERLARAFFELDEATKMRWRMELGGRAWRGYFPLGGELTSGRPDWKEGLYFGAELGEDHPLVRAGTPIHGPNVFPDHPQLGGLRETVLEYMAAMTQLGHAVMRGIALGLGLPSDYFAARYTSEPLVLFRIFDYPSRPVPPGTDARWGVGEHTDYGLLTLLWQDEVGGLQVKTRQGWIDAPPLDNTFVCNIGDMLDRMTGGLYRSTPHRVRINTSGRDRVSLPFFFDPNFEARVHPIEGLHPAKNDSESRWDGANVHAFEGRYGDYLLQKVSKVFPQLRGRVL
jgi:polar amino acid transport system ATP-binding protein